MGNIIIVDDHPLIRLAIRSVLDPHLHNIVAEADNGADAVQLVRDDVRPRALVTERALENAIRDDLNARAPRVMAVRANKHSKSKRVLVPRAVQAALGLQNLLLLNDFEALALSLPRLELLRTEVRALGQDTWRVRMAVGRSSGHVQSSLPMAVIIAAEGDHFTAGNDIMDFMNNPPTSDDSEVAQFLASLLNFPKPLLAAVKGNAVGVGTTMLLHCDVVIAGPSAKFSMPFANERSPKTPKSNAIFIHFFDFGSNILLLELLN